MATEDTALISPDQILGIRNISCPAMIQSPTFIRCVIPNEISEVADKGTKLSIVPFLCRRLHGFVKLNSGLTSCSHSRQGDTPIDP